MPVDDPFEVRSKDKRGWAHSPISTLAWAHKEVSNLGWAHKEFEYLNNRVMNATTDAHQPTREPLHSDKS